MGLWHKEWLHNLHVAVYVASVLFSAVSEQRAQTDNVAVLEARCDTSGP